MPMMPIARIPMEQDSPPLHAIVQGELGARVTSAQGELTAALHYSGGNDESLNCLLDWAMQIRETMGIDWGSALHAASVMYFG